MKIAFILSHSVLTPANGVVKQALTWKKGLEISGQQVTLINMWEKNDWKNFDIIHFFGFSIYMRDFILGVIKFNPNIVISPILDPKYSINRLRLYAHWGSFKLNLTNQYHGLFSIKDKIKLFLARSEFEKAYLIEGFSIDELHCGIVPLSYDLPTYTKGYDKESFCLHISLLADKRKNVKRLIEAARKYKFKLILGGKLRNGNELDLLNKWIRDDRNIKYLGYLTEEEKLSLYAQAKVFALPRHKRGSELSH